MALIEDYIKKDELNWQSLFLKCNFHKEYEQDQELKPLIEFLCEKVSFWYYRDIFSNNPFSPLADFTVSGRGRSSDFFDLSDDDLNTLDQCVNHTRHSLLLGFFNDILGLARNNQENKYLAAKHFKDYAQYILDNEQFNGVTFQPINRAFALLCQLKNKNEIEKLVDFFLSYDRFGGLPEYPFKVSLINMFFTHSDKTYNKILPYAEDLYAKYNSEAEYIPYSIQLTKTIFKIYKSRRDKANIKKWVELYADNCYKADLHILSVSEDLAIAIEESDKLGDFEFTNKLRKKKKELEQNFNKSFRLSARQFEMPQDIEKSMTAAKNAIIEHFSHLDGLSQLCYFLQNFNPFSRDTITEILNKGNKYPLVDLVNRVRFNENDELIFQSATASEKQKLENNTYEIYELQGAIAIDLLIHPFITQIKFDEECIALINDIVLHNELVYKDSSVISENIIRGISEKKIRSALANLFPKFEDGLRHYIEKQGIIPVIRSGGNEIVASLGQMMENNVFRKHIDSLLGKDLTQHIDYLACKKLGGNLKNIYSHEGHGNDDSYSIDEIIMFFLLLKAYCMGYDDEIIST